MGPLAFYRGPDEIPQGPEYDWRSASPTNWACKLKIMPVRTYAEIYAALTTAARIWRPRN
jgi:hypothetical protein